MKKQLTNNEKKHFEYFIKCISYAVNGFEIFAPPSDFNLKFLLTLSKQCSLEAVFAYAILSIKEKSDLPEQFVNELKQIQAHQIMIDGVLDYEIEKVLAAFEKYKVKNAPVKGYFLKKEYPRGDFRSVSDFDILFDINEIDMVKAAFSSLGYEFDHNDDTQYHFKKPPYMYIEMHKVLVHDYEPSYKYLCNQLDRTVKRENYNYSYQMSIEDHYLYLIVHHSNHFRIGGMGIRMLLDIYLYNNRHRADFDMSYINDRLKLFGLDEFERIVYDIANSWFDNPQPLITYNELETYILLSGTLGRIDAAVLISSHKDSVKKGKSRGAKLSYLMSSIFPPQSSYRYTYPYAYRHKALIPAAWFSMWFKRFFVEKNIHFKRGIKNRMAYNDDDVKFVSKVFDYVGFEDFTS